MRKSFLISLATLSFVLLLSTIPISCTGSSNLIEVSYRGDAGGDCLIKVAVTNNGNDTITVLNITAVLIFPMNLGPSFSDPNITYSVYEGERSILPGGTVTFSKRGSMPDWNDIVLPVTAFVNISDGNGVVEQFTVGTYAVNGDDFDTGGFGFSIDWLWVFPPLTFLAVLGGFYLRYYTDKPYWDIWVKDKIHDERSNLFMRWRWLEYHWMDEGKGTTVIAIWIIISLIAAFWVFFIVSKVNG